MITRLAQWWLARSTRRAARHRVGECTACAGPADHTIVAVFTDGVEAEVGGGGGTGMSADYCRKHCPGGCLKGCRTMVT